MPSLRHHRSTLLLLAFASCRVGPPPGPANAEHTATVALPLTVAAAIAGGALRAALPYDDPAPHDPGILVSQLAPDHLRIEWREVGERQWWPIGDQRLALMLGPCDTDGVPALQPRWRVDRATTAAQTPGTIARIDLHWRAAATQVTADLPPCWWPPVHRALQHALAPESAIASLREGNLDRFLVHSLCLQAAAAVAAGDSEAARSLRWRAAGSDAAPPRLLALLGDDNAAGGDSAAAAERYWQAALQARDPAERAAASQKLAALSGDGEDSHRTAAANRVMRADPAAERWLHTARAKGPDPVADYSLLSHLHHRLGNRQRARASALLAREHAAAEQPLTAYAHGLWQQPPSALARPPVAAAWLQQAREFAAALATPAR